MRRVVVTGMGIVSSIGANAQEVLASLREAKSGVTRADRYVGTRVPQPGSGRADGEAGRAARPPRDALSRRRHRLVPCRDGSGDPRFRARAGRYFQRAQRLDHRLGRAVDARDRRGGRHRPHQGPEAGRALCGAEIDVFDRVGELVDLVQDQGRRLFDLVGLRDLQPLHRRGKPNRSCSASRI